MESATLSGVAARRSSLYWLLADFFLTCPDGARVARLRRDLGGLPAAEPADSQYAELRALRDALPDAGDAAGITALAVEYTRLFGAISASYGLPPPYESVQRNVPVANELAVAVTQCYFDAGFAALDAAAPPDHLGVELKFISLLCHEEYEAWQQGRKVDAVGMLGRQRAFLDGHLLQWAPDYLAFVEAKAQHAFFRQLAAFARSSVTEDRALIEEILAGLGATSYSEIG